MRLKFVFLLGCSLGVTAPAMAQEARGNVDEIVLTERVRDTYITVVASGQDDILPRTGQSISVIGADEIAAIQGPVILIKTSGLRFWERALFGSWRKLLGMQLQERRAVGLHGSVFAAAQVQDLAALLTDIVRRAR